jgi:hypothetical protein
VTGRPKAEHLERERHRLVLAESDMKQAAVAAEHLAALGPEMNGLAERVMWTGLVVTYARPFSASNEVGPVTGQIVKLSDHLQRSLHEMLCHLRGEVFAHNTLTNLREPVSVGELMGTESAAYVESYSPMNPGALRDIAELAREFEKRFSDRLSEIEEELSG